MTNFSSNREIAIHVPDLAVAESFYTGVLGFRVVHRSDEQLEIDTGALRLYVNRDARVLSFIPSFDVPDIDAARRHLAAAGCKTVTAGSHSAVTYFQDPFGLVFDVVERK